MTERSYTDGFTRGEHDAWNSRHEQETRPYPSGQLTDFQRGWWDARFARSAGWQEGIVAPVAEAA
jgi:hypothetical protein